MSNVSENRRLVAFNLARQARKMRREFHHAESELIRVRANIRAAEKAIRDELVKLANIDHQLLISVMATLDALERAQNLTLPGVDLSGAFIEWDGPIRVTSDAASLLDTPTQLGVHGGLDVDVARSYEPHVGALWRVLATIDPEGNWEALAEASEAQPEEG